MTPKSTSWVELSTMSPTLINPTMSCYYYHLHISKKHQTQQIQDQACNFLLVNFLFWNFFFKIWNWIFTVLLKKCKELISGHRIKMKSLQGFVCPSLSLSFPNFIFCASFCTWCCSQTDLCTVPQMHILASIWGVLYRLFPQEQFFM